ncbi:Uncharacterized BCR, COG1636 [Anaerobiospirillum thomasii]|uniref:Epoxyqueuosine reductase QueH n=2 Tax=Anaerobiospirillum thomasii TaxID=179995 RepID=A0A2X0V440_9GAMM|nr:Uncharacterized BCR, COG1636 [Anaerobiospirillum thomasii]
MSVIIRRLPQSFGNSPKMDLHLPGDAKEVVMHCCCAPCAGAVLECFKANDISPVVFFYNPNIHPLDEYEKRRDELISLCSLLNFEVVVGDYDTKTWFEKIKGLENEPERGARCTVCFTHRLTVTALFAKERGINLFTSTLATSRWKNKKQVDHCGQEAQNAVEGSIYWDQDWRKQGLVGRRYELVKEFDFYNQQYCGCVYSQEGTQYVRNVLVDNTPRDK